MSVAIDNNRIQLCGYATVEDAEPLLAALIDHPDHGIDVSTLDHAHLAVVQLLHAAGRPLIGVPSDAFLRDTVLTGLTASKPA